jgi:hypothetical protein
LLMSESEHGFMLPVTREGRGREAPPAVGHLLGGWSQWRNRMAWVLDRGEACYRGCVKLRLSVCFSAIVKGRG